MPSVGQKHPAWTLPAATRKRYSKLFCGRGSYDIGSAAAGVANNLAPFKELQAALPTDVRDAPAVMDVLCHEDAPILKDSLLMLRGEDERSLMS